MLVLEKSYEFVQVDLHIVQFVHFQNNFSGRIFGSLIYSITSSANTNGLTFLPALLLFCVYSFSSLTNSTSTLSRILEVSRDNGHPCLVPNFGGITSSLSPFRMLWAVGCSQLMLGCVPSSPIFLYHEVMRKFVKGFFCFLSSLTWFLICCLGYVEPSLHVRNKAT